MTAPQEVNVDAAMSTSYSKIPLDACPLHSSSSTVFSIIHCSSTPALRSTAEQLELRDRVQFLLIIVKKSHILVLSCLYPT